MLAGQAATNHQRRLSERVLRVNIHLRLCVHRSPFLLAHDNQCFAVLTFLPPVFLSLAVYAIYGLTDLTDNAGVVLLASLLYCLAVIPFT